MIYFLVWSFFSLNLFKRNSNFHSVIWFVIVLMTALRGGVGPDYDIYVEIFDSTYDLRAAYQIGSFNNTYFIEPGFGLLVSVFKSFGFHFSQFNFILSFVVLYSIKGDFETISRDSVISSFVYFTFFLFVLNLSGLVS